MLDMVNGVICSDREKMSSTPGVPAFLSHIVALDEITSGQPIKLTEVQQRLFLDTEDHGTGLLQFTSCKSYKTLTFSDNERRTGGIVLAGGCPPIIEQYSLSPLFCAVLAHVSNGTHETFHLNFRETARTFTDGFDVFPFTQDSPLHAIEGAIQRTAEGGIQAQITASSQNAIEALCRLAFSQPNADKTKDVLSEFLEHFFLNGDSKKQPNYFGHFFPASKKI